MKVLGIVTLSLAAAMIVGCQNKGNDELNTEYDRTEAYAVGVPGGAVGETEELFATVIAIDPAQRTFTLKDDQGNNRTFNAPAQMLNFDQLKVGDKVRAMVAVERVVFLRQPGEPANDGAAGVLATAPVGEKPAMVVADTVEVTALVKAMDVKLRTATLQLADGSERTVTVRPDVEMKEQYLGRQVVLRMTSAFAVQVEPQ